MPRGASPKREREYDELKSEFHKEGRYPGREEEVASRIVNKQRTQFGETKGEKQKDGQGRSPDRGLPIGSYQHMTISQVTKQIADLSRGDVRKIKKYEEGHKNRKGVLAAIEKKLAA